MSETLFASAEEAEDAFYQAFKTANLTAMMRVWLDADYVECIHPMQHSLMGIDAIEESWQEVFNDGTEIQFETVETHQLTKNDLAIHVVNEDIRLNGNQYAQILATNIYENTPDGWRMILHHAAPASQHPDNKRRPTVH